MMHSEVKPGILPYPGGEAGFGSGSPVLCVNDQCGYLIEEETVRRQILDHDFSSLVKLAGDGRNKGMDIFNVQLMIPGLIEHEQELLPAIIEAVIGETGCGIAVDTRDPEALKKALRAYPYRALCNCVNGEKECLEKMLPVIAEYGGAVGTALVDESGIPETLAGRLRMGEKIVCAAEKESISRSDIVLDAVCFPAGAVPDSMRLTLHTLKAFKEELGVSTLLGISNAGFGMPNPLMIDSVYFTAAASWGMDVAMISPYTPAIDWFRETIDFLMGSDPYASGYLSLYRKNHQAEP
jgi:5-methyltetrahydrofolate--homocysteine methyltransferase